MLEIGVMLNNLVRDRLTAFAVARELGFRVVHTNALPESWLLGPNRESYLSAARASGISIASMFIGFEGQSYADIPSIARTVGLFQPGTRAHRTRIVCLYSDLAAELEVPSLTIHLGFLPEDRTDSNYSPVVECVRILADYCARQRQTLHFETGQERATVLLCFMADVNRPNIGVNFDPANLILYDKDDPLEALAEIVGLVKGVHCKDAMRTKIPGRLGTEVPIGQGQVDFPAILGLLRGHGYQGPLIIEREHGPTVRQDVLASREYLQQLLA